MWMPDKVYGFSDCETQAAAFAKAAGLDYALVDVQTFPDGESRVRVPDGAKRAAVFRPLHNPNAKLIEVVLAASALRDQGAEEVALIAPYLPYMRQDIAFHDGEAVSQRVVGDLLARAFDRFASVDPHLHRTPTLSAVFSGKPALCLQAAPVIAEYISNQRGCEDAVIVGPDIESEPLVRAVAEPLNAPWIVADKTRHGDRDVEINLPKREILKDRHAVIVDDVISSGGTVITLAELIQKAGSTSLDVYTTHALFDESAHSAIRSAGVRAVISCDSVSHPTNAIPLAGLIAEGLRTWQ